MKIPRNKLKPCNIGASDLLPLRTGRHEIFLTKLRWRGTLTQLCGWPRAHPNAVLGTQPLEGTYEPRPVSLNLPRADSPRKWNHTIVFSVCLPPFPGQCVFKAHPHRSRCPPLVVPLYSRIYSTVWTDHIWFIRVSDEHLWMKTFLLALVNCATMDTYLHASQPLSSIPSCIQLALPVAGSRGSSTLTFWGTTRLFCTVGAPCCLLTGNVWGLQLLHAIACAYSFHCENSPVPTGARGSLTVSWFPFP